MLKTLLYSTLGILGVLAALVSPLWGAVAVVQAYLMNPVVFSPQLATVRFQFFITASFIAGLAIRQARGVPKIGGEGLPMKALVLYGFWILASTQWAVISGTIAQYESIDVAKSLLVAFLLPYAVRNERQMMILLWACLIGATHAGVMHVVGGNLTWIPGRLTEEYGIVPDMQASVMVFFLPVALVLAVTAKDRRARYFCLFAALIILDSIVNSYQRAYFVAIAAEVCCLGLLLPGKLVRKLVPAAVICGAAFLFAFTPATYWDWISTITDHQKERSASSRFVLLECSKQMLADHPILGVGYGNYNYVSPYYLEAGYLAKDRQGNAIRSAHNTFASVACNTGLIGISLYLTAIGGAWWLLRGIRKRADVKNLSELEAFAMGLEIGLIGWAAGGMFHSNHEDDPVFWTVGFAMVMTRIQLQGRRQQIETWDEDTEWDEAIDEDAQHVAT